MLTRYLWDYATNTCLAEMDEQGETLVDYTVDPQTGELISENHGGQEVYHRYDGDGNTRQTADSAGNVLGEATYDAFGETVAENGDMKTTYRFRGQRGVSTDPLTGDLSKAKQNYSPLLGRGLSAARPSYQQRPKGLVPAGQPPHGFPVTGNRNNSSYFQDPTGGIAIIVFGEATLEAKAGRKNTFRCGGEATYNFRVQPGAPCDGFIVQRVLYSCNVGVCVPRIQDVGTYFEAWFIAEGEKTMTPQLKRAITRTRGNDAMDTAKFVSAGEGVYIQNGVVRFFCISNLPAGTVGPHDGLEPTLRGWARDQLFGSGRCSTSPGRLQATQGPVMWFGGGVGPVGRRFRVTWGCCPCAFKRAKVNSSVGPDVTFKYIQSPWSTILHMIR